jgi:pyrroline-5-carboxylate reductase
MKISFIGGGNMATALIAGLAGKVAQASDIHVVDPNPEALERLRAQYGVTTAPDIGKAVAASDVIVLAVKPQQMRDVALRLQSQLDARPLLLSIAAGIRGADLSRWLGGYGAIVRTMPNTPALIGRASPAWWRWRASSEEQRGPPTASCARSGRPCGWTRKA